MITNAQLDYLADVICARLETKFGGNRYVDSREAASVLGCSVATVERLTRSGKIPSCKVGSLRRYRRADLIGHLHAPGGGNV